MKLVRFGPVGLESPGLVAADGTVRDASAAFADWDEEFFATDGLESLAQWAAEHSLTAPVVPATVRLGPPVARPSKLVCIGLNYRDHAAEAGLPVPEEPVVFMKATTALCGPCDDVVLPAGSTRTDWEVELAFVIGRTARSVEPAAALGHVAGYTILHDVSERSWQMERGGQWVKGKSFDTFAPCGPWLVTPDEVPDPADLTLELRVNGAVKQAGSTRSMVFGVAELVSYLSQCMTLLPGDIVSTGTPPGVGLGRRPQEFLRAGDLVELSVTHLGRQQQIVR